MTDWLSIDEAADELGVHRKTMYVLVDKGEIPAYRIGRVFRIKNEDLGVYLESVRVQPGTISHNYSGPERLAEWREQRDRLIG